MTAKWSVSSLNQKVYDQNPCQSGLCIINNQHNLMDHETHSLDLFSLADSVSGWMTCHKMVHVVPSQMLDAFLTGVFFFCRYLQDACSLCYIYIQSMLVVRNISHYHSMSRASHYQLEPASASIQPHSIIWLISTDKKWFSNQHNDWSWYKYNRSPPPLMHLPQTNLPLIHPACRILREPQ